MCFLENGETSLDAAHLQGIRFSVFGGLFLKRYEKNLHLSYDDVTGSDITECIRVDKLLVVR